MIEGIQKPDKGEITIMGKKWKGNEDELHKIIGLSLQETSLLINLRVTETLLLFSSFLTLEKNVLMRLLILSDLKKSGNHMLLIFQADKDRDLQLEYL